ncbi:ABC transporter permease subunit [Humibacter soli]
MSRTPRTGAVPSRVTSTIILVIAAIAFVLPLYAMTLFIFRPVDSTSGFTLIHLKAIIDPAQEYIYDQLFQGLTASLVIALVTVAIVLVILLPTMILASLRFPKMRQTIEFICLLPITIPTVVLAIGFIPVYQAIWRTAGNSTWTLAFAIGIIALPFAYRPIQSNISALDLTTLNEASRSLGANWFSSLWHVILPNLRRGILTAALLTVSVVLGEYTIAAFLSQNTFQTALFLLQQTDPYVATAFALAALIFVFLLLVLIGSLGSIRRARKASS